MDLLNKEELLSLVKSIVPGNSDIIEKLNERIIERINGIIEEEKLSLLVIVKSKLSKFQKPRNAYETGAKDILQEIINHYR